MKKILLLVTLLFALGGLSQTQAQKISLKNFKKKAKEKLLDYKDRKEDETIDRSIEKVDDKVDEAVWGNEKSENDDYNSEEYNQEDYNEEDYSEETYDEEEYSDNDDEKNYDSSVEEDNEDSEVNETASDKESNEPKKKTPTSKPWSKYNFVPGDQIIFEDDLVTEESGEFPSRWDLLQGSAENASLDDGPVINFENKSIITPLMDGEAYLPNVFTIEFDAYFDDTHTTWQSYNVRFWDGTTYSQPKKGEVYWPLYVRSNGASFQVRWEGKDKKYDTSKDEIKGALPTWKHIAIAFNKRSMKVFIDQHRVLNIPNLKLKPQILSIEGYTHREGTRAIKNIRIAQGGKKLYDRVMADGKFVTRGILFDVNKATLKPESMGVINEIGKMMQEHEDLSFSIEGHTDSDGDDQPNLTLSARRAQAVKAALIERGIGDGRLHTKGKGESVPVADNTTAEGKANNRRVEFIKL